MLAFGDIDRAHTDIERRLSERSFDRMDDLPLSLRRA
jgi:hypothetical protein